MSEDTINLNADGIRLSFDTSIGMIKSFTVTDGDAGISPLHRAPWVGMDEALPDGLAPHLYKLGGDFFCAPFGQEKDGAPLHGWPANACWSIIDLSPDQLSARLDHRVNDAEVIKELSLRPDHPFVYQKHTFVGGSGSVPVANHANISLPNGGFIRTSAKSCWMTPATPQETDPKRGRSGLVYPASSDDPTRFPSQDGTTDLTLYPWFQRHEDFVAGLDAPGGGLGWTAVTRPVEGDLLLSLKRSEHLPMTMLWHSNGGRDYPPWSGRHFSCLGIEEGAAGHVLGPDREKALSGPGALQLSPARSAVVKHVIGAIAWPAGSPLHSVSLHDDGLEVLGDCGTRKHISFDTEFLQGS